MLWVETTLVNEILGPRGLTEADKLTLAEKPLRLVKVTVELSPGLVIEDGVAEMVKSGAAVTGDRKARTRKVDERSRVIARNVGGLSGRKSLLSRAARPNFDIASRWCYEGRFYSGRV